MKKRTRKYLINSYLGLPHPFGISVFEDFVYWTDWKTRSLTRANKFTGSNVKSISNNFRQPMSIASFHPLRQKQGKHLYSFIFINFVMFIYNIKIIYLLINESVNNVKGIKA